MRTDPIWPKSVFSLNLKLKQYFYNGINVLKIWSFIFFLGVFSFYLILSLVEFVVNFVGFEHNKFLYIQ